MGTVLSGRVSEVIFCCQHFIYVSAIGPSFTQRAQHEEWECHLVISLNPRQQHTPNANRACVLPGHSRHTASLCPTWKRVPYGRDHVLLKALQVPGAISKHSARPVSERTVLWVAMHVDLSQMVLTFHVSLFCLLAPALQYIIPS